MDPVVDPLLRRHGQTFADEIGADAVRGSSSDLFRLLCAALLFSARIRSNIAVDAARALAEAGWTTPEALAGSSWEERARTLNAAGYARYDERTATMLGDTAQLLLERYDGDLRQLRDEADRDPGRERTLLKECKGLGDVGVDIFCREVQASWDELFPFVDDRAQSGARALGLPSRAERLAALVDKQDFPRLVAALVRCDLAGDADDIRSEAG